MLKKKGNKLSLKKVTKTKKIKNFIFLKNQLKKKIQIIKNIKHEILFIEKKNKNYLFINFFLEDYPIQKDKSEIGSSNLFKIKIHNRLKKKHLTKKMKSVSLGPLRVKLIQKEQEIKRLKSKKINLKKHQAYKLLILNTCLSFGVISLIYFNFYKLALIGFGYLLIKNNSVLKKKKKEYLFQKDKFNKYHKKFFPILYYVVPIIGVSSGLGMFYTGYLLNGIYQEIFFEEIHYLSYKPELDFLLLEYYVFSIIFFSYIFIDFVISLYVIQKTNTPFDNGWKAFLAAGRVVRGVTVTTSVTAASATIIAGAPEPSPVSNIIHTRTYFGRGWDAEPGDLFAKVHTMKLQHVIGNELLINKLEKLNIDSTNNKIVSRNTYEKLLQDPEIRRVLEKSNLSNEELYAMGVKNISEIISSAAKDSAEAGITSIGQKIDNGIQAIGNVGKSGVESLKNSVNSGVESLKKGVNSLIDHASQGSLKPLPEDESQDKQDIDMSDTEFEAKQKDVAENSPGKKAVKDQDLLDARKRGLGKK